MNDKTEVLLQTALIVMTAVGTAGVIFLPFLYLNYGATCKISTASVIL
jgi:hypothetical protein